MGTKKRKAADSPGGLPDDTFTWSGAALPAEDVQVRYPRRKLGTNSPNAPSKPPHCNGAWIAKAHYQAVYDPDIKDTIKLGDTVRCLGEPDVFFIRIYELFEDTEGRKMFAGRYFYSREETVMANAKKCVEKDRVPLFDFDIDKRRLFYATEEDNANYNTVHPLDCIDKRVSVKFLISPNEPPPPVKECDYWCDVMHTKTFYTFRSVQPSDILLPHEVHATAAATKDKPSCKAPAKDARSPKPPSKNQQQRHEQQACSWPKDPVQAAIAWSNSLLVTSCIPEALDMQRKDKAARETQGPSTSSSPPTTCSTALALRGAAMPQPVMRTLELCAGAGGLSFLAQEGEVCGRKVSIRAAWACDIDKHACQAYRLNHPNAVVFATGIEQLLWTMKHMQRLKERIGPGFRKVAQGQRMFKSILDVQLVHTADTVKAGQGKGQLNERLTWANTHLAYLVVEREAEDDGADKATTTSSKKSQKGKAAKGTELKGKGGKDAEASGKKCAGKKCAGKKDAAGKGKGAVTGKAGTAAVKGKGKKAQNSAAEDSDEDSSKDSEETSEDSAGSKDSQGSEDSEEEVEALWHEPQLIDNDAPSLESDDSDDSEDSSSDGTSSDGDNSSSSSSSEEEQEQQDEKVATTAAAVGVHEDYVRAVRRGIVGTGSGANASTAGAGFGADPVEPQDVGKKRRGVRKAPHGKWVLDEELPEGCEADLAHFLGWFYYQKRMVPLPGDVDVVTGGPPCQEVSGLNRHAPLEDIFAKGRKNSLAQTYFDIVEFLQPRFILLEQVMDILKKEGARYARFVVTRLSNMRYQTRVGTIAAGHHGTPQVRFRCLIWGAAAGELLPAFPEPQFNAKYNGGRATSAPGCRVEFLTPERAAAAWPATLAGDVMEDLPEVSNFSYSEEHAYRHDAQRPYARYLRRAPAPNVTDYPTRVLLARALMEPSMRVEVANLIRVGRKSKVGLGMWYLNTHSLPVLKRALADTKLGCPLALESKRCRNRQAMEVPLSPNTGAPRPRGRSNNSAAAGAAGGKKRGRAVSGEDDDDDDEEENEEDEEDGSSSGDSSSSDGSSDDDDDDEEDGSGDDNEDGEEEQENDEDTVKAAASKGGKKGGTDAKDKKGGKSKKSGKAKAKAKGNPGNHALETWLAGLKDPDPNSSGDDGTDSDSSNSDDSGGSSSSNSDDSDGSSNSDDSDDGDGRAGPSSRTHAASKGKTKAKGSAKASAKDKATGTKDKDVKGTKDKAAPLTTLERQAAEQSREADVLAYAYRLGAMVLRELEASEAAIPAEKRVPPPPGAPTLVRDHRPLMLNADDYTRCAGVPRHQHANYRHMLGVVVDDKTKHPCTGHSHCYRWPDKQASKQGRAEGCLVCACQGGGTAVAPKSGNDKNNRVDHADKDGWRGTQLKGCAGRTAWLPTPDVLCPRWCITYKRNLSGWNGGRHGCFGRYHWRQVQPTVVTRAEPHNLELIHPVQDRVLTIRENARHQGFPDFYVLAGDGTNPKQKKNGSGCIATRYKQIGNAVAPPVAAALGRCLLLAAAGHELAPGHDIMVVPVVDPDMAYFYRQAEADGQQCYAVEHGLAGMVLDEEDDAPVKAVRAPAQPRQTKAPKVQAAGGQRNTSVAAAAAAGSAPTTGSKKRPAAAAARGSKAAAAAKRAKAGNDAAAAATARAGSDDDGSSSSGDDDASDDDEDAAQEERKQQAVVKGDAAKQPTAGVAKATAKANAGGSRATRQQQQQMQQRRPPPPPLSSGRLTRGTRVHYCEDSDIEIIEDDYDKHVDNDNNNDDSDSSSDDGGDSDDDGGVQEAAKQQGGRKGSQGRDIRGKVAARKPSPASRTIKGQKPGQKPGRAPPTKAKQAMVEEECSSSSSDDDDNDDDDDHDNEQEEEKGKEQVEVKGSSDSSDDDDSSDGDSSSSSDKDDEDEDSDGPTKAPRSKAKAKAKAVALKASGRAGAAGGRPTPKAKKAGGAAKGKAPAKGKAVVASSGGGKKRKAAVEVSEEDEEEEDSSSSGGSSSSSSDEDSSDDE